MTTTTLAPEELGYWTTAELRAALRISKWAVRQLMDQGLPHIKPSPQILRFPIAECRAWLAETGRTAA